MTQPTSTLYVSAPVNALVEGIYEAHTSISEIKTHGDFGIGTFNNLDGEMVMLDGQVYQLKADGSCNTVPPEELTPFACVTFFKSDTIDEVKGDFDYTSFLDLLKRCTPSDNMVYAIRVEGTFPRVKTRSVPRQENYRPLVDVAREQPEFEYDDISGTMVGFFCPSFLGSINVPGYHLHFLSDDRTCGGHLLECSMTNGEIAFRHIKQLTLGLPITFDHLTIDYSRDTEKDLEKAEK